MFLFFGEKRSVERLFRFFSPHCQDALWCLGAPKFLRLGFLDDVNQGGTFEKLGYPPAGEHGISCRFEKIIGFFEREMPQWIDRMPMMKDVTSIINAGAADGDFIIGLGCLFPDACFHAFGPSMERSRTVEALDCINGVDERLVMGEWLDPEAVRSIEPGEWFPFMKNLSIPEILWMTESDGAFITRGFFLRVEKPTETSL